jgi:hypothetical protein
MEILQLLWSRRCPLVNSPQLNCQINYSAISSQPALHNSTELKAKVKVKVTLLLVVYRVDVKPLETQDLRFFFKYTLSVLVLM